MKTESRSDSTLHDDAGQTRKYMGLFQGMGWAGVKRCAPCGAWEIPVVVPGGSGRLEKVPEESVSKRFLSPLRGCFLFTFRPTAHAAGWILAPLHG
jgi:hypothetical protein